MLYRIDRLNSAVSIGSMIGTGFKNKIDDSNTNFIYLYKGDYVLFLKEKTVYRGNTYLKCLYKNQITWIIKKDAGYLAEI
jgi:YHS domain-containing protein